MLPTLTRYLGVLLVGVLCGVALSRVTLSGITLGAHAELWVRDSWSSTKSTIRNSKAYRDVRSFRNMVRSRLKEPMPAPKVANPEKPESENPSKLKFTEEDAAFMMELLQAENKK